MPRRWSIGLTLWDVNNPRPFPPMGRGPPSWATVEVFVPRELGPQGNNRTVECPSAGPLLRRLGLPWARSQEYAGLLLRKLGPPNCR